MGLTSPPTTSKICGGRGIRIRRPWQIRLGMSAVQPTPKLAEPAVFLLQRGARGVVDGRTRAGKFITGIENELLAGLRGPPTAPQRLAIRRVARLTHIAEELDATIRKAWVSGNISESLIRQLTDLHRAIGSCIRELTPRSPEKPEPPSRVPTLAEVLAREGA